MKVLTFLRSLNHHLFQPVLYQMAAGILAEGDIAPLVVRRGCEPILWISFARRRPDHLAAHDPGLIHAQVLLHGAEGPWATRPGFDEIGACVCGIFALGGTLENPKQPAMLPIVDNIVGWFGTIGVLQACRRRASEGGSYRVRVSLTRVCLWLTTLGILDKEFATKTAGSMPEHTAIPPELFTAETPLGTYQGMTDQIEFSSLPQGFTTTVLQPMGANLAEWLPSGTFAAGLPTVATMVAEE